MNEFRRQFIEESIDRLSALHLLLRNQGDPQFRQTFRIMHTVKGGAQMFGLQRVARLAAELEDQLTADTVDRKLLLTGISHLLQGLEHPDGSDDIFIEQLRRPHNAPSPPFFSTLPKTVFDDLSTSELTTLVGAARRGATPALITVDFEPSRFAADFARTRNFLDNGAEVVAALPFGHIDGRLRYSFVIMISQRPDVFCERAVTQGLVVENATAEADNELATMLSGIVNHAATIASESRLLVEFVTVANPVIISRPERRELSAVLLHLTRNAVTHAFTEKGVVEIRLLEFDGHVSVTVADDGRGLNYDRIRQRGIELGLLNEADNVPDSLLRELIFEPGFTTAAVTGPYAGRGVGLDAVKAAVERLNGRVECSSRAGRTVFEVNFPLSK